MESIGQKLRDLLGKHKYVLLVVLAGLVLMLLPTSGVRETQNATVTQTGPEAPGEALEEILSQIRGVGKVRVLLTELAGEEILYVQDEDDNSAAGGYTQRRDTVIVTDSQRNQAGLILQRISPTYRGAVIVCQGGDDPQVRLAVVEAVSNATGLSTDRISVWKMK